MTKEELKKYQAEWYQRNKERIREKNKGKAEEIKAYMIKWREEHREEQNQKKREKRNADIEASREREREYRNRNKDAINSKRRKKYAEDDEYREKTQEYFKKYREKNREKLNEKETKRYHDNCGSINARRRDRYGTDDEYRERRKAESLKYREENPEAVKAAQKTYYENNKGLILKRMIDYYNVPENKANILAQKYRYADEKRGYDVSGNITGEWLLKNIFGGQKCIYCGDEDWTHLGADRIDNTKPHTPDNVVCSCGLCNITRQDKYTVEEFKEYRKTHPRELNGRADFIGTYTEVKNGVMVLKKKII